MLSFLCSSILHRRRLEHRGRRGIVKTPPDESNVGAVKEGHGLAPASGMK
jgi:hypothetical protein